MIAAPQDVTHISRILDVCQELKALTLVLESTPVYFSVELAALAARREYLNLEKWLNDRIMLHGLPLVQTVLTYLDQKVQVVDGLPLGQQPGKVNVPAETIAIFFKVRGSQNRLFALVLRMSMLLGYSSSIVSCISRQAGRGPLSGTHAVLAGLVNHLISCLLPMPCMILLCFGWKPAL